VSDPAAPLPRDAVLLHVGPHKTGTTAVQGLLNTGRTDLAAHDVTYPGRWSAHHQAAWSLLGRDDAWSEDPVPAPDDRRWVRLAQETAETSGRVVISSEYFARCDAAQRARVIRDLGASRAQILVAARNPGSMALSTWQQEMREGRAGVLADWLDDNFRRSAPAHADTGFWGWADPATLVEDWREVVGIDRIHVVVIDETDRSLLPRTFEQLLDLPAGMLAELIRQAIALTRDDLSWDEFSAYYRAGFARRLHEHRKPPPTEDRPSLPAWATEQAAAEAASMITRLRASGAVMIGDLDALQQIPAPGAQAHVTEIPVDLAAEAIAGVIDAAQQRSRRLADRAGRLPIAQRQLRAARARLQQRAADSSPATPTLADASTRELVAALRGRLGSRLRPSRSSRNSSTPH
jgi:hypothetical protein